MKKKYITLSAMRGLIYTAMLLLSFVLQFIIFPRSSLPFPLLLLIPVTLTVSMYEFEFAGLFAGLFAGILWDTASSVTDGLYALIFPAVFMLTGLLSRHILRNTCLTAVILTAGLSLLPSLLGIIYTKEQLTGAFLKHIAVSDTLPGIISSVIITVPVYFAVDAIYRRFSAERA